MDLAVVVGQVGEVRMVIVPTGSVHVAGERWTVRAESRIDMISSGITRLSIP